MSNILPFGTSTDGASIDIVPLKLFGCTVIDFNVSADWSSQGGSLSCRLIEDEASNDRLQMPVLGSPVCVEARDSNNAVRFQYIGIVDSFSRNANTSKTYSVTLSSPLKILESTQVILDGYVGGGWSVEGSYNLNGMQGIDFGHNNSLIDVTPTPGPYHWWNVSNLINVFGILENDHPQYRVPQEFENDWRNNVSLNYGGYGFSGRSQDGIPLIKLMWALHVGINHLPKINANAKVKTHGGNLLFGRHNYNLLESFFEATPFYYHFDAIHFYNQIVGILGPQYRVNGQHESIRDLIAKLCDEANLEFYTYIDIYSDKSFIPGGSFIGDPTLQEEDPYILKPAEMNWDASAVNMGALDRRKFTHGGNYGGTIRVATINKNIATNPYRPFSNIAYNVIGLEVPDIKEKYWQDPTYYNNGTGIHPGVRPIDNYEYGLMGNGGPFSNPLDGSGIKDRFGFGDVYQGFKNVGTDTLSNMNSGTFPVATGDPDEDGSGLFLWNSVELSRDRLKNSDISLKLNDVTSMKVVTGGYQSRMVHVPGNMLRHYWGDILVPEATDPQSLNTPTNSLGYLTAESSQKVPVVTPLLDPRDVDDYILIDMKSAFGRFNCHGVLRDGVYAASMLEVRCAMRSVQSWKAFFETYKYQKLRNLVDCFYPNCTQPTGYNKAELEKSTETINNCGGAGYVGASHYLGLGNMFSLSHQSNVDTLNMTKDSGNNLLHPPSGSGSGQSGLGIFSLPCALAVANVKQYILPAIFEKVKEIGETHYGKSWYAPVPYAQTIQDLDGSHIVGNFKRSWELTDAAYTEPSLYYAREIPQSNHFISDGKISAHVNYDHNFIIEGGPYDTNYAEDLTGLVGQPTKVFNFSEYSLGDLCVTRYGDINVVHAAPQSISNAYNFLPFEYEIVYNRAILPFSDIVTGRRKRFINTVATGLAPSGQGQSVALLQLIGAFGNLVYQLASPPPSSQVLWNDLKNGNWWQLASGIQGPVFQFLRNSTSSVVMALGGTGNKPLCPDQNPNQIPNSGFFNYDLINGIPALTQADWLYNVVPALQSFNFSDNGRFSLPFVKFQTARVFLPVPAPGQQTNNGFTEMPTMDGYNVFTGSTARSRQGQTDPDGPCPKGNPVPIARRQHMITDDHLVSVLQPFQPCVCPRSFNYPQISTRYMYGPWMTSLDHIVYRGKIEYEQDESLVPENFIIPLNFGPYGGYGINQTSGLTGMNLAGQGRANAIDNFGLFAVEEGTITIPGPPRIVRIGDALSLTRNGQSVQGIPNVTDIRISVGVDALETTYTFKTIAQKFGRNSRDLEKKLTKISNDIKRLKLK